MAEKIEKLVPRHLVIVRHGESEGDVRRQARQQNEPYYTSTHPRDERQTAKGHHQSQAAGVWITQFVLKAYNIDNFDLSMTSPLARAQQSAKSLAISQEWTNESRLSERSRGSIQGFTQRQHQDKYPDSHRQMKARPFYWVPPSGESILNVAQRSADLLDSLRPVQNVLLMTHRDFMWAVHVPLQHMSYDEVAQIDTEAIRNAQIAHYTNVDPRSGNVAGPELIWKRTVTPWDNGSVETQSDVWQHIYL